MKQDIKQMKQMIKECNYVFGWVNTHSEDGVYLELKKCSILHSIKQTPMNYELSKFDMRDNNILYIN